MNNFRTDLEHLINRYSMENASNTADFILAQYLDDCLHAFDAAVNRREEWYGRRPEVLKAPIFEGLIDPPEPGVKTRVMTTDGKWIDPATLAEPNEPPEPRR